MLRFDPFGDLDRLNDQLGRSSRSMMAFDAVRDDDAVTIYLDVPGVSPDELEVDLEKNELTVRAERTWRSDDKQIIASERPQGTFTRRLVLGDALDTERLEASLDDGVLTIRIPVDAQSHLRRIDVAYGGGRPARIGAGDPTEADVDLTADDEDEAARSNR